MKQLILFIILYTSFSFSINSQTEVMAWGNMTGIRVDGELVEFESSFRVVGKDWSCINTTGKERQYRPQYIRDGQSQTVKTTVDNVRFEQIVKDIAKGEVSVSLEVVSDTTQNLEGVYFSMDLPVKRYDKKGVKITGKRVLIKGKGREFQLNFSESVKAFVRNDNDHSITLYIPLLKGNIQKGQTMKLDFTIKASGEIDHSPVEIVIDKNNPGRLFEGLGGNFRLQNPQVDPQVINYCLENLRVAWGRVEMPWRNWHPVENEDPIAEARAGRLDKRVDEAMKMAQRLAAKGMPVIVSAWFPPEWAIDGDPESYQSRGGVQAFRLDPAKQEKIYKSLTDYLLYLKQAYGVEAVMYSFNESDLGIDVLHTPQEHADFIKGLGTYMASKGLATKMLLGDNSDATTFDFILPAMNDPETHKYIGAVSFHSWRGCDDETLHKWAEASRKLNVPLIVGEGSTDAAAWTYPQIFAESTFALYEINLYARLCAICQPLSILQWQLTSDYSILWGDGVYGSTGPLRPTQRFWNLKQLASTPEQSFSLPFTCSQADVNGAVFGNLSRGEYAVHLVNNGASREATIKGLPESLKEIKAYVTNSTTGMEEIKIVKHENGMLRVELPPISFITLIVKE